MDLMRNKKSPIEKDTSTSIRMGEDVGSGIVPYSVKKGKEARKDKRLDIAHEALRLTFGLLAVVLLLAFCVSFFCNSCDIFNSFTLTSTLAGLFSVLTLILGFVAGTSID